MKKLVIIMVMGKRNIDIAFFDSAESSSKGCYFVHEFIACEIKCNINTFIKSILESKKKGNDIKFNRNYEKLEYLKGILLHFKDSCKVIICSLIAINPFIQKFLDEYDFNCIQIWNPI